MPEIIDYITSIEFVLYAISAILGVLLIKTGIDLLADVQEVFEAIADGVSKDSEEGRNLSNSEIEAIRDHVFDLAYKAWDKWRGGATSTVLRVIRKLKFW